MLLSLLSGDCWAHIFEFLPLSTAFAVSKLLRLQAEPCVGRCLSNRAKQEACSSIQDMYETCNGCLAEYLWNMLRNVRHMWFFGDGRTIDGWVYQRRPHHVHRGCMAIIQKAARRSHNNVVEFRHHVLSRYRRGSVHGLVMNYGFSIDDMLAFHQARALHVRR